MLTEVQKIRLDVHIGRKARETSVMVRARGDVNVGMLQQCFHEFCITSTNCAL